MLGYAVTSYINDPGDDLYFVESVFSSEVAAWHFVETLCKSMDQNSIQKIYISILPRMVKVRSISYTITFKIELTEIFLESDERSIGLLNNEV